MQLLIARYVGRPSAARSTIATVHAPQSPSAQPSLLPVCPFARRYESRETFGDTPATRTVAPLSVSSKVSLGGIFARKLAGRDIRGQRCQSPIDRPSPL